MANYVDKACAIFLDYYHSDWCSSPSGAGRCVWRVHFLPSSRQPPQQLLRPAGWTAMLEFDDTFLLHIAFQKSSSLTGLKQTQVKHLLFIIAALLFLPAWICLCVTCQGLLQSCSEESLANDPNIRMITLFDNEEVRVCFLLYALDNIFLTFKLNV